MPSASSVSRAITAACAFALAGSCCAQLRADPLLWSAPPDMVKRHAEETIDLRTVPEMDNRPLDPYAYKRGLFSSLGLYEYKRPGEVPGQYTKPHYAFGMSSDMMRNALSMTGLDAENCVAPMIRLRARETTASGASGVSMNVFARCTFR